MLAAHGRLLMPRAEALMLLSMVEGESLFMGSGSTLGKRSELR